DRIENYAIGGDRGCRPDRTISIATSSSGDERRRFRSGDDSQGAAPFLHQREDFRSRQPGERKRFAPLQPCFDLSSAVRQMLPDGCNGLLVALLDLKLRARFSEQVDKLILERLHVSRKIGRSHL